MTQYHPWDDDPRLGVWPPSLLAAATGITRQNVAAAARRRGLPVERAPIAEWAIGAIGEALERGAVAEAQEIVSAVEVYLAERDLPCRWKGRQ